MFLPSHLYTGSGSATLSLRLYYVVALSLSRSKKIVACPALRIESNSEKLARFTTNAPPPSLTESAPTGQNLPLSTRQNPSPSEKIQGP